MTTEFEVTKAAEELNELDKMLADLRYSEDPDLDKKCQDISHKWLRIMKHAKKEGRLDELGEALETLQNIDFE